jgi:hypothetical protein
MKSLQILIVLAVLGVVAPMSRPVLVGTIEELLEEPVLATLLAERERRTEGRSQSSTFAAFAKRGQFSSRAWVSCSTLAPRAELPRLLYPAVAFRC